MQYKVQIAMDNGQSKIICIEGNNKNEVIEKLLMAETPGPLMNKFSTVNTREGNCFTYCVGKLSSIEILY